MAEPRFRLVPYRILPCVDWFLIAVTLALTACGIFTLWGATASAQGPAGPSNFALLQSIWAGAGLVLLIFCIVIDYHWLRRVVWLFYLILLALLVLLLVRGHSIKGAESWFNLGGIHFQPSEPGKIVIILALAQYLAPRAARFRGLRHTIVPLGIVLAPLGLILIQPDLGTAAVLVPTTAAMFWVAGLRKWIFISFMLLGVGVAVAGYPHLKDYQKQRIISFLDPAADPRGKGYNVIQAQTALGSGQMFGKGWCKGTQTSFKFLPESHTDFIFPTVGEQFGMFGCTAALVLLFLLVASMIRLAGVVRDMYGVLIITGLGAMLITHITLNIGMTVGLLPVTGLPLPFFSYGGSFMLTCMTAVGLSVGIGARRGL